MRNGSLERAIQLLGRYPAGQAVFKRSANSSHLLRRFVDKLEPEVTNSRRKPGRKMRAGLLRFGSENSIAAADVGHHRMRASTGIS